MHTDCIWQWPFPASYGILFLFGVTLATSVWTLSWRIAMCFIIKSLSSKLSPYISLALAMLIYDKVQDSYYLQYTTCLLRIYWPKYLSREPIGVSSSLTPSGEYIIRKPSLPTE